MDLFLLLAVSECFSALGESLSMQSAMVTPASALEQNRYGLLIHICSRLTSAQFLVLVLVIAEAESLTSLCRIDRLPPLSTEWPYSFAQLVYHCLPRCYDYRLTLIMMMRFWFIYQINTNSFDQPRRVWCSDIVTAIRLHFVHV